MADKVITYTTPDPCACCGAVTCPPTDRMLLPPLTEDTGIWYASESDAQDAIDNQTSNCIGYTEIPPSDYDSLVFSATDGGTTLNLAADGTDSDGLDPGAVGMWASITLSSSGTISLAWDYSSTGTSTPNNGQIRFSVYDSSGTLVETMQDNAITSDSDSGTFTTASTQPAGRYILLVSAESRYDVNVPDDPEATVGFDGDITSTSSFSVNQITALWDDGGNVACLDC